MMAVPAQLDIDSWLALATQDLSREARQRICEEIQDHYWNCASYYEEQGKSAAEAHRDALAQLGDVQKARYAFRDAHASKLRYLFAGLLSMVIPLLFAGVFLKEPEYLVRANSFRALLIGAVYLMQPAVLLLPMITIVCSGYSLLTYRFHFPIGRWRAGLLIAGVFLVFLPGVIDGMSLIFRGFAFFGEVGITGVSPLRGTIRDVGILLLSLGLITMGYHIKKLKHSLYGTKFMLVTSSWVWGICQIGLMVVGTDNALSPLVFVLMFTATVFCVFLGWMFVKAAFMGRLFTVHRLNRTGTPA